MTLPPVLAAVDAAFAEHFGHRPQRASMSFVGVEPIEILRFEPIPGERVYLSLGMARRPMTAADEGVLTDDGPRAELMVHLRDATDEFAEVWRRLAVLAAAPAVEGVVYRSGMSVDLGERLAAGSRCTGALLTDSPIGAVETADGPVAVLQVVPAASSELAWCRVRGSAALRAAWETAGTDLLDLARPPVELG